MSTKGGVQPDGPPCMYGRISAKRRVSSSTAPPLTMPTKEELAIVGSSRLAQYSPEANHCGKKSVRTSMFCVNLTFVVYHAHITALIGNSGIQGPRVWPHQRVLGGVPIQVLAVWQLGGGVCRRPPAVQRRGRAPLLSLDRGQRILGRAARKGLRKVARRLRGSRRREPVRRVGDEKNEHLRT